VVRPAAQAFTPTGLNTCGQRVPASAFFLAHQLDDQRCRKAHEGGNHHCKLKRFEGRHRSVPCCGLNVTPKMCMAFSRLTLISIKTYVFSPMRQLARLLPDIFLMHHQENAW
jgi:hypothetical protein